MSAVIVPGVWRLTARPGCVAPCGSVGAQRLDIECAVSNEDWAPLLPVSECTAPRPSASVPRCYSHCVWVDPFGDVAAAGSSSSPVRSVAECVRRWEPGLEQLGGAECAVTPALTLTRSTAWTPFACAQECRSRDGCTHIAVATGGAKAACRLLQQGCTSGPPLLRPVPRAGFSVGACKARAQMPAQGRRLFRGRTNGRKGGPHSGGRRSRALQCALRRD
jgi:hypothetical protein